MDILKAQLNSMLGGKPAKRKAPVSRIIAILPDGTEKEVARSRHCGRPLYSCEGKSNSKLEDLAADLSAKMTWRK